jgi:hypothetical protein
MKQHCEHIIQTVPAKIRKDPRNLDQDPWKIESRPIHQPSKPQKPMFKLSADMLINPPINHESLGEQ